MKIEKMLIGIILVSSLFLASLTPVEAADSPIIVIDEEDDVFNTLENETTNNFPNIDITKLEYTRIGLQATITMTVKGVIQNLGDLEGEEFGDTIAYSLYVDTSFDTYYVVYMNQQCIITYGETYENLTDYSIDESVLTVRFSLNNTDETYTRVSAESDYIQVDLSTEDFNYFIDTASDQPLEITIAEIPDVGSTGETIEFKVFPDYGHPPYTYEWDFGDEATSTDKNPTHTYTKAGTYECSVNVTDELGNYDSYSGEITIVTEGNGETGTPILLLLAIIIIIIVIGVVVVIWIIRR